MLLGHGHKGFVSALHNALRADVDPGSGGHLAVHHQALFIELVKVLPVGPVGHQVGVGQQHPGGVGVGLEHAHRLAGLDQQGFVIFQTGQHLGNAVKAGPVAGGTTDAAVHHQILGALGHVRVQVVVQHAVGGFGEPALADFVNAGGRLDDAAGIVALILL